LFSAIMPHMISETRAGVGRKSSGEENRVPLVSVWDMRESITYIGKTNYRESETNFGIKPNDRFYHMHVIGRTGMGKSTLLENLMAQDFENGEGFAFLDPHGQSSFNLLDLCPPNRSRDVVYFNPHDIERPIALNVLEDVPFDHRTLVAQNLLLTFRHAFQWDPSVAQRLEYILYHCIRALLDAPGQTLLGVSRMLRDKTYRDWVITNIEDSENRAFWLDEYANYTDRYTAEAIPAIQNKIGKLLQDPRIRNIVGQPRSAIDLRHMMDNGGILIANLSAGRVGGITGTLLGSILVTKIYLAAMARSHRAEKRGFHLFVDEFQNYTTDTFEQILSEARKNRLSLCVAHQYIDQLTPAIRAAVFGNVGTTISFRVGAHDADTLAKEFAPVFGVTDLLGLDAFDVYIRLAVDGKTSRAFSARTLPPRISPYRKGERGKKVSKTSRVKFGTRRGVTEKRMDQWMQGRGY